MIFATFDEAGNVTGHYSEEIHGSGIPADAEPMTEAEWQRSCRGELARDIAGGRWVGKPAPAPAEQLKSAKDNKEVEIRNEGSRRLSQLASPYRPEERESWHKQEREARAYQGDPATAPLLSAMAAARGIALDDMIAKVMENVTLFEAASGHILGTQQALLDQLTAATTVVEVEAIGWPQ